MATDKSVRIADAVYEGFTQSMDAYYQAMSQKNRYDITIDAIVVDIDQKLNGKYLVRSDGAEFDAYATSGSYYKDDQVLVQIPNGDYGNQKMIIGRKVDENVATQFFNFKLPFDDFIGLKHLNKDEEVKSNGAYWANYPGFNKENIPTGILDDDGNEILSYPTLVWKWCNPGFSTQGQTKLGIQADWTVLLGMYQPLRGTFGFKIITKGISAATEETDATEVVQEDYFTNRDMYGNPYAFYTPYTQQKLIDITNFMQVNEIEIHFYQDYNFADASNAYILYDEYNDDGTPAVPENIMFDSLDVYIGISNEDLSQETVMLYSYEALSYTGIEKPPTEANKITTWTCDEEHNLQIVWIHQDPANHMFTIIDDVNELLSEAEVSGKDTHVYWYRRNYDDDIKDSAENLFPGQEYTVDGDKYSPKFEDGNPLFEPDSDTSPRNSEYKELFLDLLAEKDNPAYSSRITRYGGAGWTFIPAATDKFVYTVVPRGNKSREKFKVVIQHHGTHTASSELVLKNTRDVESEMNAGAANNTAVIKIYKTTKIKDENDVWTNEYVASEDGSLNAFHVYDENNKVLHNDDNERFDTQYYYLQIHIRNEDTYLYEPITTVADNGQNSGTSVSWSIPRHHTMIKSTESVNSEDALLFGIDAANEPVRYQNFVNNTIKFKISETLNNRNQNNLVGAIITRNGKTHHIEKNLMFGRAEGQGYEFTPIIEIIQPAGGSYICQGRDFQIGVAVYNRDGTLFETPSLLSFSWREIGGQSTFVNYGANGEPIPGYLIGEYSYTDSTLDLAIKSKYENYRGNVISGRLSNDKPPVFEVKVHGASDYPLIARFAPLVCNNYEYKQPRDILIPSRVEFKSDGTNPLFYNDIFSVEHLISGDNSIAEYELEYPAWQINNEKLFHLEERTVSRTTTETDENGNVDDYDRSYKIYKLVSNAEFTNPSNPLEKINQIQWTDDLLKPEFYTYIWYQENSIWVAQALAFDRNYYSSSLVNDWNGVSLTWDEENGAVLSTMIAAGTKDNNNRFTGVMMGDWHTKGDESLDVPGIYGYHQGAQSFGLKIDGTGFIGKSGHGRIHFDGNETLISNANKTCYINLNPVKVNDPRTPINAFGNQSFSQNFIYCEVPRAKYDFSSITNSILGPQSWVKKYFTPPTNPEAKDYTKNDYFIVDPNYGVLTTGGIVARYGALGNWMISNEGMYQKSEKENAYMYLGFDDVNTNTASDWKNYKTQLEHSEAKLDDSKQSLNILNEEKDNADREKDKADGEVKEQQAYNDTEIDKILTKKIGQLNENNKYPEGTVNYDIAAAQKTINNLNTSKDEKTKWLLDLETQQRTKASELGKSKQQKENSQSVINGTNGELSKLASTNASLLSGVIFDEMHINSLQSELNSISLQINSADKDYERYLSAQSTEYGKIQQQLEIVQGKMTILTNKQITLNEARNTVNNQRTIVNTQQQTIDNKKTILLYKQHELYDSNTFPNLLTTGDFESNLTSVQTSKTELEKEKTDKETRIKEIDIEIESLQADSENYAQQLTVLQEEKISLQNRVAEIGTLISDINNTIKAIQDLIAESKIIDALEITLEEEKNKSENFQKDFITATNDYNEALDDYNTEYLIYNKYYEAYNDATTDIINFNADLMTYYNSMDTIYKDLKRYENGTNEEYENYSKTADTIKGLIIILKEKRNILTTHLEDIAAALEAKKLLYKESVEQLPEAKEYLEKINTEQGKIDECDTEINDLEREIKKIKTDIIDCKNSIKNINNDINIQNILLNGGTYINEKGETIETEGFLKTREKLYNEISNYQALLESKIKIAAEKAERADNLDKQIKSIKTTNTLELSDINKKQKIIKDAYININKEIIKIEIYDKSQTYPVDMNNYNEIISAMIKVIEAIMFEDTIRYAIYVADQEPQYDASVTVMPYFSVSQDGTMFARKGKIANTWVVDDVSLTYEKNNNKIFLGQGSSNSGRVYDIDTNNNLYICYPPNDNPNEATGENVAVSSGWDISAGIIKRPINDEDHPRYEIKFGVTSEGRLYSEYGRIGGWDINKTVLSSTPSTTGNKIILDAANNKICFSNGAFVVDAASGSVFLGKLTEDKSEMIGNVFLAEFGLSGKSAVGETQSIKYASKAINAQNQVTMNTPIGGVTGFFGWEGITINSTGTTIGVTTNRLAPKLDFTLDSNKTNYLQFFDTSESPNHHNYGIVLAVGNRSVKETDQVEVVFYPKKNGAILGLDKYRWNLIADSVNAYTIEADTAHIKKPYMTEDDSPDPTTIKLIASQWWVTEQLNKIWDALADIAETAASASASSYARSIVEAQIKGVGNGAGRVKIQLWFKRGNGNTLESPLTGELALGSHGHTVELAKDGSFGIKIGVAANSITAGNSPKTLSLGHYHPIIGEFSDGKFTVESGDASFSKASQYIFDVRETSWFKNEIQKAIDAVVSSVQSVLSGDLTMSGNISCSAGDGNKTGSASAAAAVQASLNKTISGSYDTSGSWSFSVSMDGKWSGVDSDSWSCNATHGSSSSGGSSGNRPGEGNLSPN